MKPPLKLVTHPEDALFIRARELHATPEAQKKWLAAIDYLRTRSKTQWVYDVHIPKKG